MNFWHGARTKYQFFAFFISPMDFTNQKPLSRGQGEKNSNLLTKKTLVITCPSMRSILPEWRVVVQPVVFFLPFLVSGMDY